MDINYIRSILYQFPVAIIVATIVITNYGCGSNPPFAPSGSTVTMLNPPGDITIRPNAFEIIEVEAIVENEAGALNGVRVFWTLSFAGPSSFCIDTNGDGLPDQRCLQLIDPEACPRDCALEQSVSDLFFFDALVDSPWQTVTDDQGISRVEILISNQNGENIIDPASLEVSTRSGSVDVAEFAVNAQ